jgi:hypothetical protein
VPRIQVTAIRAVGLSQGGECDCPGGQSAEQKPSLVRIAAIDQDNDRCRRPQLLEQDHQRQSFAEPCSRPGRTKDVGGAADTLTQRVDEVAVVLGLLHTAIVVDRAVADVAAAGRPLLAWIWSLSVR